MGILGGYWIGLRRMNDSCNNPFAWGTPEGDIPVLDTKGLPWYANAPDCRGGRETAVTLYNKLKYKLGDIMPGDPQCIVCQVFA